MANRAWTVIIVLLSLAGIIAATLAYGEHYNTSTSPCQINAIWDCGIVNKSPFAMIHGIPIAMIGIVGYALLAALAGRFPWITAFGALGGFAFALRYSYIEWKVLQTWCLYCVTSQGIIFLICLAAFTAALSADKAKRHGRA